MQTLLKSCRRISKVGKKIESSVCFLFNFFSSSSSSISTLFSNWLMAFILELSRPTFGDVVTKDLNNAKWVIWYKKLRNICTAPYKQSPPYCWSAEWCQEKENLVKCGCVLKIRRMQQIRFFTKLLRCLSYFCTVVFVHQKPKTFCKYYKELKRILCKYDLDLGERYSKPKLRYFVLWKSTFQFLSKCNNLHGEKFVYCTFSLLHCLIICCLW